MDGGMHRDPRLSRRAFLNFAVFGLSSLAVEPYPSAALRVAFPGGEQLGRVLVRDLELKLRPDPESKTLKTLEEDTIVVWLREVVAPPPRYQVNWRWVETPDGFLYAPNIQPVRNSPNQPLESPSIFGPRQGMWAEVTLPYVDLTVANPPARSPWVRSKLERGLKPRLYYSQIVWVDQIEVNPEGQRLYRVTELYGSYGDVFWAAAEAFRPLNPEEMEPLSPGVSDKRVIVDNTRQTLSCFEGETEVYYCTTSTGVKFDPQGNPLDRSSTPLGAHPIWRKLVSIHMSGGTTGGGWDLAGIGWTTFFVGSGVALHATFWHNNFGVPMSRGCVNLRPEDAKWVFRWTEPFVPYDPGDVTISMPGGTTVEVIET